MPLLLLQLGPITSIESAFAQSPAGRLVPHTTLHTTAIAPDQIPDAKITLRVFNYAHIDAGLLVRSEKVASAIFESVGVQILWSDCALSPAQARSYPACQSDMDADDLVLRILPRSMAAKLPVSGEPLGFAQPCPEGEPACQLNVFYSTVDELAAKGYRADLILGHVIAHELAHALIGAGHSDSGILRGHWSRDDLQHISWGLLLNFTVHQSNQLRSAVFQRTPTH